ncbi:MAG: hypothetical protein AB7I37_26200 [Pirellulales bacterium]
MATESSEQEDSNRFSPYGPGANADETRQAQHMAANDTPVDVNFNSVVCRSQALTVDALGKHFSSNDDLRQKIADSKFAKLA